MGYAIGLLATRDFDLEHVIDSKKLPYNEDAERVLIGAMLIDASNTGEVVARISKDDFHLGHHKSIYEAALSVFEKTENIDVLMLADELERRGELYKVGGYDYLNELTVGIPRVTNIEHYAQIVKEKALLRRLAVLGQEITKNALAGEQDAVDAIDHAEHSVAALREGDQSHEFTLFPDSLQDTFQLIQERAALKGELIGLPTGFLDLDRKTSGLHRGDLIIVAARPAMGKTSFCLNLAVNAALRANAKVAVFSLEMPSSQLTMRLLGSEARVGISELRSGRLENSDWDRLSTVMPELTKARIFIEDSGDINVYLMRAKLKRLQRDEGLDLVVIDYLQLMSGTNRSAQQNRTQEVSEISRGLKIMAKELNVPVIALSQLSRAAEQRSDHRPQLADLRESGSIEQDADMVCFLYRDDYYRKQKDEAIQTVHEDDYGLAELIIAKHRNGPTGVIKLAFFKKFTRFENYSEGDFI
ncbi:MAG: replicative DNA helicase [Acidobacteria bacterium]|nr:replicative DNA helicase [Acidobacteriota bacterium]